MSAESVLCIRAALPEEGLEMFLDRPWKPVINALTRRELEPSPPGFPLACAAQAPNSRSFLSTLGKPLAIARNLESEPGIWWLSSTDERYDFIIFSDCHRKNAWKGGQLCVSTRSSSLTENHASMRILCLGFEQLWGLPPPPAQGLFWSPQWFEERLPSLGDSRWPTLPMPCPRISRKP